MRFGISESNGIVNLISLHDDFFKKIINQNQEIKVTKIGDGSFIINQNDIVVSLKKNDNAS